MGVWPPMYYVRGEQIRFGLVFFFKNNQIEFFF